MSLLLRINLWLVGTFLVFLTAAVLVSRLAMLDEARDDAISDARLLLESAQGARDYTTAEVEPLLVRPGAECASICRNADVPDVAQEASRVQLS